MISTGVLEANSILYVSSASQLLPDVSLRPPFVSNHLTSPTEGMFSDRPSIQIIQNALIVPSLQPPHLIPMAPIPIPLSNVDPGLERPLQISTIVSPLEKLPEEKQKEILNQLEYYFSPANLSHDQYMADNMDMEKYISISCLANFPKIRNGLKEMTEAARIEYITQLLKGSKHVELDASECKVRPVPFESSLKPRDALLLRGIEPGTLEKEICSLFECVDCQPCINCKQATPDCWYVTFPSEKDAMDAYQLIMKSKILLRGKSINARIKQRLIEPTTFSNQSTLRNSLASPGQSRPGSVSQPDATPQPAVPPPPQPFTPPPSLHRQTVQTSHTPVASANFAQPRETTTPRSEPSFQRPVSSESRPLAIFSHPQALQAFVPTPVPTPMVPQGAIAQIRTPGQAMPQKFYQAFQAPGGQIHILSHQPQGITLVPAQAGNPYGGVWPTQQLAFFDPASGHIVHMPAMPQGPQIILQDMSRFAIQNRVPRPTMLIAQQPLQNAVPVSLQLSSPSTFPPPARPQPQRSTDAPSSQPSIVQLVPPPQLMQPPPQSDLPRPSQQPPTQVARKYGGPPMRYPGRQSSVEEAATPPARIRFDPPMPPSLMADINQQNSVNTSRSKVETGNTWQSQLQQQAHHQQTPPQQQQQQSYSDHRPEEQHQLTPIWPHHAEPSHLFQRPPPHLSLNIQHNTPPPHNLQQSTHNMSQNSQYSTQQQNQQAHHNIQSNIKHNVQTHNSQHNPPSNAPQHNVQMHNTQPHNSQHNVQPLNVQHNVQGHNTQQLNAQHNVQHASQHNAQSWRQNASGGANVNSRDEQLTQKNTRPKRIGRNNELMPNLANRSKMPANVLNQFDLESNSFPPLKHNEISNLTNSISVGLSVDANENAPLSRLSVSTDQSESSLNNQSRPPVDLEISSNAIDGRSSENQLRPSYAQITQRGKDAPVSQSPDEQPPLNYPENLLPSEIEIDTTTLKESIPSNGQVAESAHDTRKPFFEGASNQNRRGGGYGPPRGRGGKAYYNTSRVNNY